MVKLLTRRCTRTAITVLVVGLISGSLYAKTCSGLERLPDYKGKRIGLRNNALLFSTNKLKIDIDGSKRSYGLHDQGAEHICNGLSPITPKRCQNTFQRGSCFEHCKNKFREWHEDGHDPAKLHKYMRSIGLGGANGSVPNVKLQPPLNTEMFVSHTSVRYGTWKKGQPLDSIEKQEAQLEPFEVPFFVIPGKFRSLTWDATPGDLGVAVHAQDPVRYILFVVGDVGGNLAHLQWSIFAKSLKFSSTSFFVFKKLFKINGLTFRLECSAIK